MAKQKKRAVIARRQPKLGIQEWASGYQLHGVEDAILEALVDSNVPSKLQAAIVSDFAALVTESLRNELYVGVTETPGVLAAYVGGDSSSLTPHTVEATFSMKELAAYLAQTGWAEPGELVAWRDEIRTLLGAIEKEISSRYKKEIASRQK